MSSQLCSARRSLAFARRWFLLACLGTLIGLVPVPVRAELQYYWNNTDGSIMTGQMTVSSSVLGTGLIQPTDILDFDFTTPLAEFTPDTVGSIVAIEPITIDPSTRLFTSTDPQARLLFVGSGLTGILYIDANVYATLPDAAGHWQDFGEENGTDGQGYWTVSPEPSSLHLVLLSVASCSLYGAWRYRRGIRPAIG
jgi:hypothetical protein